MLCGSCLECLPDDIYRGKIKFSPQSTTGPQDWLDARFQQGSGDFDWNERERTWRKPNIPAVAHKQSVLRASFIAKHARIDQVMFKKPAQCELTKVTWTWRRIQTLLSDGYNVKLVKSIIIGLPRSPAGEQLRILVARL